MRPRSNPDVRGQDPTRRPRGAAHGGPRGTSQGTGLMGLIVHNPVHNHIWGLRVGVFPAHRETPTPKMPRGARTRPRRPYGLDTDIQGLTTANADVYQYHRFRWGGPCCCGGGWRGRYNLPLLCEESMRFSPMHSPHGHVCVTHCTHAAVAGIPVLHNTGPKMSGS